MATSQLTIYNNALILLGQPTLSALTDSVENRRILDKIWDENARDHCLEQGLWNFATRTAESTYDSSVSSPDFGFQYAHTRPTDWIRTVQLAGDEFFRAPLTDFDYNDEQGYIWSNYTTLYWRYISNNTSYGYDLSNLPQSFVRYVEAYLAEMIAPRLSASTEKMEKMMGLTHRRLMDARSKDALNEGSKFRPDGNWVRARRGYGGRRDMGSGNRLTG